MKGVWIITKKGLTQAAPAMGVHRWVGLGVPEVFKGRWGMRWA